MEQIEQPAGKKNRNIFLLILCILIFIDAGSSFLQMLFMPIYASEEGAAMAENVYKQLGSNEMYEQMATIIDAAQALPSWYFILASLPFALAVVGAAFVLKMKPIGFHLYVISQILAFACQNFLLKEPFQMSWISILCSICIALCFYFQLKNYTNTPPDDEERVDY